MTSIAQKQQIFSLSNYNNKKSTSNFNAAKNTLPTERTVIADRRGNEGEKSIEQIRAQNAQAQGKVQTCDSNTAYDDMSIAEISQIVDNTAQDPSMNTVLALAKAILTTKVKVRGEGPTKEERKTLSNGLANTETSFEKIRSLLKNSKKCDAISTIKSWVIQLNKLTADTKTIGNRLGVCLGTVEECLPKKKVNTYPSQSI
jgi:hypothetical protein